MARIDEVVYDPPKKDCRDCLAEFDFCHRPAPYPGPRCKTHMLARRNAARRNTHRNYVEKRYNLPAGGYDKLKEFQGGKCAICDWARGKTKNLAVDHDHKHCDDCAGNGSCGKGVRGLLCNSCNIMVGRIFRDNPEIARRAYEYLTDPPYQRMLREELRQGLPEGTFPVSIEPLPDWNTYLETMDRLCGPEEDE